MTIDTNELRRLVQEATPGPWEMFPVGDGRQKFAVANSEFRSIFTVTDEGEATFGTVYDDADAKFIAAANPAAVSELLDRLEAAEKERDAARDLADRLALALNTSNHERDNLRAKVEAMERQRPEPAARIVGEIGEWVSNGEGTYSLGGRLDAFVPLRNGTLLYALPGAQPAPSVQDVPAKSLKPVIDWLRNGCAPMKAADELEILIAAAPETKP